MAEQAAAGSWAAWQMVDSLYPTGGFAHSLGLEAAVQEKLVTGGGASLGRFLSATLHQTANFALPVVFSAYRGAAQAPDAAAAAEAVLTLNAQATALYSNHVAKKASLAQGAAMLRLAVSTYAGGGGVDSRWAALLTVRKEAKRRKHPGVHHAVVFGAVCALLDIDAHECQRMYLFVTVRDVLSAATRLNLVGPMEATRTQFEMRAALERVFQQKKDREIQHSYSSAPVLDLIQAMHDQLYTRIFNS